MVLDSLQPTCGIATSRQEFSAWTAEISKAKTNPQNGCGVKGGKNLNTLNESTTTF
jgi:hypothetical protein